MNRVKTTGERCPWQRKISTNMQSINDNELDIRERTRHNTEQGEVSRKEKNMSGGSEIVADTLKIAGKINKCLEKAAIPTRLHYQKIIPIHENCDIINYLKNYWPMVSLFTFTSLLQTDMYNDKVID